MSNDLHIKGILLLNYNLKKLESKYTYSVIVTENVSEFIIQTLRSHDINVLSINFKNVLMKYTDDLSLINEIMEPRHYYGKFLIFNTVFKKAIYLDTDLLLLKNIDHLFENDVSENIYMVNDVLYNIDHDICHIVKNTYNAGFIVFQPNSDTADTLFNLTIDLGKDGFENIFIDQSIFNKAIHANIIKCTTLDQKYNINPLIVSDFVANKFIDTPYIVHFSLQPKPWDILDGTFDKNQLIISPETKTLFENWINLYVSMIKENYLTETKRKSVYCKGYYNSTLNSSGNYEILDKIKTSNVAVVMWYDDNIKEYADITYEMNKMYCEKHNLDLIVSHEKSYLNRHSAWEKLPMIIKNLQNYEYVIWIDSDAFFYNNSPDIKNIIYENPDKNFIFSKDSPNPNTNLTVINSGLFIVKNTEYSLGFLNKWAYDEELYLNNVEPNWWEQGVLFSIYNDNLSNIQDNSFLYDYGILQHFSDSEKSTPYVYHLPGQKKDIRINISNKYYNKNLYDLYNKEPILTELENIVKESGVLLEGNCFYVHHTLHKYPELYFKQLNLFAIGRTATKRICEIGFNAGHSTMLMLMGRNTEPIDYTIFDIGEHRYTKECLEYIKTVFPHVNFQYIEGDSTTSIPEWISDNIDLIGTYDIVHVDGGHSEHCIKNDMKNANILVKDNGYVIVDDTQVPYINNYVDKYIDLFYTELTYEIFKAVGYPHRIIQKTN